MESSKGRTQRSSGERKRSYSLVARLRELPVWARWATGIPAAIVALVVLLIVADIAIAAGRIHPGVRVGEVRVGGMTKETAAEAITEHFEQLLAREVTAYLEEEEWSISPDDVGISLDAMAHSERAFGVGRSGNLTERVVERFEAWFEPVILGVLTSGEESALAKQIALLAADVDVVSQDASVTVDGADVVMSPAVVGVEIDKDVVREALLGAFVSEEGRFALSVVHRPVAVNDSDAEQAYRDAIAIVSGPVVLAYEELALEVPAEEIGGWIGFRKIPMESEEGPSSPETSPETVIVGSGVSGTKDATSTPAAGAIRMRLEVYLVAEEVSATVGPITEDVGRTAQDASFAVSGGKVTIIDSEVGLRIDTEGLTDSLLAVLRRGDSREVVLRMKAVQPEFTTEEAESMGITERIADYTTTYSAWNGPRVNNIHTLADALDETLVAPGEVFSFNEVAGPRTAAAGYQEAGTIVNGRLVPTLGGGICQVGTTAFNAVFFSGLEVGRGADRI